MDPVDPALGERFANSVRSTLTGQVQLGTPSTYLGGVPSKLLGSVLRQETQVVRARSFLTRLLQRGQTFSDVQVYTAALIDGRPVSCMIAHTKNILGVMTEDRKQAGKVELFCSCIFTIEGRSVRTSFALAKLGACQTLPRREGMFGSLTITDRELPESTMVPLGTLGFSVFLPPVPHASTQAYVIPRDHKNSRYDKYW